MVSGSKYFRLSVPSRATFGGACGEGAVFFRAVPFPVCPRKNPPWGAALGPEDPERAFLLPSRAAFLFRTAVAPPSGGFHRSGRLMRPGDILFLPFSAFYFP